MDAYDNIVIFSPIRSGSTLIYNIIKKVFLSSNIIKTHNFNYNVNNLYFIAIRHPYNSIISYHLTQNNDIIKDDNIGELIEIYKKNGGIDLTNVNTENNNIVLLKYECFVDDFNYIFNVIENKLNMKIECDIKNEIMYELNIENVINYTKKYKSFHEYCIITHFHGNHISSNKGNTDFNKYVNTTTLKILINDDCLNKILEMYNY